jgi:transcriptional regulator with XRE-family HTH domain
MLKIGNKIKKLRELKNFTQEYMAQNLNLSPNGYGKIERDEVDITMGRLEAIAKIFEMDMFQVMSFDEKQIFNITNSQNSYAYGFVQSLQTSSHEMCQTLINQLQDEVKYLRVQNQELMILLKNK